MPADQPDTKGGAGRVKKNLRPGLALAWVASPRSLIRYSLLGMVNAATPPVTVLLGAARNCSSCRRQATADRSL